MKKIFILSFLLFAMACEDDFKYKDLLPDYPVDVAIDLSLPQYLDLQVAGGWAYTPSGGGYGIKGIFIYNFNNSIYYAYERACPHLELSDCAVMEYSNGSLVCPCDDSRFNFLNGGVSTSGIDYQAREYHVQIVGAGRLRITNY